MRHLIQKLMVIIFLLGSLLAGNVRAQEQQGQPFMPRLLKDGDLVEGTFAGNVTAQLYGFNGSAGDHVTISLHAAGDSYLVLFGSAGEFLAYNDDAEKAFGDAAITDFELPHSGRYYVLATSYDYFLGATVNSFTLAAPEAYEISLTGATPPTGMEDFDFDGPVVDTVFIPFEASADDQLSAEYPIGFFTLAGQADSLINIGVTSNGFRYPVVYLFAPDGSRIGLANTLSAPLDEVQLPASGDYLIMVMDAFFIDRLLPNARNYGLGTASVSLTASE